MNTSPRDAVVCFHRNGMPYRITLTVTGIVTFPTVTDEPPETELVDVIALALAERYPEFQADPKTPVVTVQVQEILE